MAKAFKDSGKRQDFGTGAVRDTTDDKGRMDLLPFRAITWLSKIFQRGMAKYGERNWEKGIPVTRFVDSGMRHLSQFMIGDTSEPHLAMAFWNIGCALDTLLRIKAGLLPQSLWGSHPGNIEEQFKVYE